MRRRWIAFRAVKHPLLRWTSIAGGVLFGLALAWVAITALLARQDVKNLDNRVEQVTLLVASGHVDAARSLARSIPALADRAHSLTTGPAWWVGAHIPFLGRPLEVGRGTALSASRVGRTAVPELVGVAGALNPEALRASGDTIRLAPLVRVLPELQQATRAIDDAYDQVTALPQHTWLSPVDHGRASYAAQLDVVRGYVDAASRVARVLPSMLGQHRRQTYFIGLQNEAELRGTGGLPGAFAIATAYHGTIHFTRFESDIALEPPVKNHAIRTGLHFGAGYTAAYGDSLPTQSFLNSNISPNFPYAAQIWAAMWQRTSGQHVDGAIALDPTALAFFLNAVGPAHLPNGGTLDAASVITFTERDQYALIPDFGARKALDVSILHAAADKIVSGAGNALSILRAASESATQQRLQVWSSDPSVESVLRQTNFAGTIPVTKAAFAGPVLNNEAGGKLDFYLTRSMTYASTGCGTRDVLVTLTFTNNAPASGLPAYVTHRYDDPPPGAVPGDNHDLLDYYATAGAQLESVTVDGKLATATTERDLGHPIFRVDLQLPRGATQTVVLHLTEPGSDGVPQIWQQPGVAPMTVQTYAQKC